MPVTEILQWVDGLIFKQTGKHLSNLQKDLVQGLWNGHTYAQMANDLGYDSENHIGSISRELYKILSEQIGENVSKNNFRATIERVKNSFNNSPLNYAQFGNNNSINLCPKQPNYSANTENTNHPKQPYHDLTLAPTITNFYNRQIELQTLSSWLNNQNTRLISILGLSGIGKTYLVKQFIDLNLQNFDIIIWKSLKISPSLDHLINYIIAAIKSHQETTSPNPVNYPNNTSPLRYQYNNHKLSQVWQIFQQQKCLIILDDVQEIFTKHQCAGEYQTEFKDYKDFFTNITSITHQSHLILISQEKCPEMRSLDQELYPAQSLEISSLNDIEIFSKYGLKDEDYWLNLLNLYEGNPAYLEDISSLIKDIFRGKVGNFLKENAIILTPDIKFRLNEIFARLSPTEQQIALALTTSDQPLSREELDELLSLSSIDLISSLQSLYMRYLLKIRGSDKTLYSLSPIVREYVINKYKKM